MTYPPPRWLRVAADRRLRSAAGPLLLVACLIAIELRRPVADEEHASFEQRAAALGAALDEAVGEKSRALASLASLFAGDAEPEWRAFQGDATAGLGAGATGVLVWAPRVLASGREAYEQTTGRNAQRSFLVRELDGRGVLMPARRRAGHAPVHLVAPAQDAAMLLGFDLTADKASAVALSRSGDTAGAEVVGPVVLPARAPSPSGAVTRAFVVLRPLYRGGAVPGSIAERRRELRGHLLATIELGPLLTAFRERWPRVSATGETEIDVRVAPAAGGDSAGALWPPASAPVLRSLGRRTWDGTFELDGRPFDLRVTGALPGTRVAQRRF